MSLFIAFHRSRFVSIQFNPQASIAAAMTHAQVADGANPPAPFTMAPVGLTPLVPPSSGQAAAQAESLPPQSPAQEASIAAGRRQAFFAERHKALLDRLEQPATAQPPAQGKVLPAPQRAACVAVLAHMAAALPAAE